jgi:FkbM family methyltransferase
MQGVLAHLASQPTFSIVQIGAYVGDTDNDPIYAFVHGELANHPGSTVVLVEPISDSFARLQVAYRDLDVVCVNAAIAERAGEREMYRLASDADPVAEGLGDWVHQLSSLREDRMTSLWDSFEQDRAVQDFYLRHRTCELVRCTTMHQLLADHSLNGVDLLQMDTEGYDYEILKTIDFGRVRPRFINYERVLLLDEEEACRKLMRDAGYVLFDWGLDTLCVTSDPGAVLAP